MIDCAEAVRQLWEYVENELDPNDRERVDQHLAFCRRCCGELEFANELRKFMQTSTGVELPLEIELRFNQFLSKLEAEGAT
jgi:anti-sigma factor (TIGR02949 family)